ncbi:kelch-like protein 11 [Salarias fasciatus]|nr:kelch-like protein 11 [Salarias fasciatus]
MSISGCLRTCVIYTYEFFPKVVGSFRLPVSLSLCGMAAAAEEPEERGRSGGALAALTGDGEPEEAEEFTCPALRDEVSRRQNEQRKAGQFCDVSLVFTLGGAERVLPAHRCVLAGASPYFAVLLGGQFSESRSGRVELREWSSPSGPQPDSVERVIQFMYTGEVRLSTDNVHDVLELADRFLLEQLKTICAEFLMKKLCLLNCLAVVCLAHMYTLDRLAQGAAEMIRRNLHKVIRNEEFCLLPFCLVRSFLRHSEIIVNSDQELFEAIVRWVYHDHEREEHFEELFGLLRLLQITPTYLTRVVRKEPLVANSAVCRRLVSETLEAHALRYESLKPSKLGGSHTAAAQPRLGQNMDVILVVGGVSKGGACVSECLGYFVAEDRWVFLPHIHYVFTGHAVAVTEDHVYVADGSRAERYNPSLNSWEPVSNFKDYKCSLGLTSVKGILYEIGGYNNSSPGLKDVSVYKPKQNVCLNLEPAPKVLRDVRTLSVEDRYIYLMARTLVGVDGGDGLTTVTMCYDTESGKWQEVESLPLLDNYSIFQMAVASTNFYHTASCCPKNYKVTLEAAQEKLNRNFSSDILDSLPSDVLRLEGAAICSLGEDIYVIGGWRYGDGNNADKQYSREAYCYCAERKHWTLLPPLPQSRCRATACHVRIPYQYLHGFQRFEKPHQPPLLSTRRRWQIM